MKYYFSLRRIGILMLLLVANSILFISCKKDDDDAGSNVVEITDASTGGTTKTLSVPFGTGSYTVADAITLKNKASGSGGTVRVKLTFDDAAVTASDPNLKVLASSRFSIGALEIDVPANGTVNVPLTLNRTNLSVDSVYGIGFKIDQVNSGQIAGNAKSIIARIDMRNRWDGRYKVTGTFTDFAAPTITFTEQEVNLITSAVNQVYMIPKDLGIPGYLILSGTSLSYYGSFGPVFHFDVNNNKLIVVTNYYGQPAANTRSAQIDPSGSNQWDATTKSFTAKFWMNQPNTVTTPPYHRTLFVNTMIYLGTRF